MISSFLPYYYYFEDLYFVDSFYVSTSKSSNNDNQGSFLYHFIVDKFLFYQVHDKCDYFALA